MQHLNRKVTKNKNLFEVSGKNTTNVYHNFEGILKENVSDADLVPAKILEKVKGMKITKLSQSDSGLKPNCFLHKKRRSASDISENNARKYKKVIQNTEQLCSRPIGSTEDKNSVHLTSDEYKPGMLSNLLQIKTYGRLIFPWDPSFGLDPTFKLSDKEKYEGEQMLKINPLFDLSKRKNANSASSNHMENTVFVGNLPFKIRNIDLKKLFRKFGKILHIKIRCKKVKTMQNLPNEKKNLAESEKHLNALVRFKNVDSCKAALQMNGALFEGHHLRVSLTKDEGTSDPRKCVFLGNLAFGAKDDDVWKAFEGCGEIENVRLVRDERTGIGKGFGYINFKSADSVELALKLDGTTLLDRSVRIRRSHSDARSLSNSITIKKKRKKWKQHGKAKSVQHKHKQEIIEKDINFVSAKPAKVKEEAGVKDQNITLSIHKQVGLQRKKRQK